MVLSLVVPRNLRPFPPPLTLQGLEGGAFSISTPR